MGPQSSEAAPTWVILPHVPRPDTLSSTGQMVPSCCAGSILRHDVFLDRAPRTRQLTSAQVAVECISKFRATSEGAWCAGPVIAQKVVGQTGNCPPHVDPPKRRRPDGVIYCITPLGGPLFLSHAPVARRFTRSPGYSTARRRSGHLAARGGGGWLGEKVNEQ